MNSFFTKEERVRTKTLYNYIDVELLEIKNIDLPFKVKRTTKPPRIRKHKKHLGTSICERPSFINDRLDFGHWEIDTVIGCKKKSDPTLLTITERMTRKEIIRKLPDKTAVSVQNILYKLDKEAGPYFSRLFKSITADNGSEFAELATLESKTDAKVYFAHPYTSSERGTNERHNGLIRRFIPKGKDLNQYSTETICCIQTWCNTLPRKILRDKTPDEAFEDQLRILLYS